VEACAYFPRPPLLQGPVHPVALFSSRVPDFRPVMHRTAGRCSAC